MDPKDNKDKELEKQNEYVTNEAKAYGYTVSRNDPFMAKHIAALKGDDPFLKGFRSGKETFEREQKTRETDQMPSWLKPDALKNAFQEIAALQDKNKNFDKER